MSSTMTEDKAILVAGVGMTPVGEHWEVSLRHLALNAITAAREDAGGLRPQLLYVANMLAPSLSHQSQLGALLADFAGLSDVEAVSLDAAGASGGLALRQAYLALKAEAAEVALVVGVEKVTDRSSREVDAALATATDADFESDQGITPTAQAALLMRRYLYENQAPQDALAGFSVNAHANAVFNPNAMFRRAIKPEQYAKAGMISDPMNMFDVAPLADGAAAVILAREDVFPEIGGRPPVALLGSGVATGRIAIHDRSDPLTFSSAQKASIRAYEDAGLQPEQMDLFELHDQFSIYAALSMEAAGFAVRGEGWKLAHEGQIKREGQIPISTFGGSKARGDSGAATGLYQAVEVILQLQDRAGENQIEKPLFGMAQCLGGAASTAASHIFGRLEMD
jgi:acetyl-CoA C-acetyltransferase